MTNLKSILLGTGAAIVAATSAQAADLPIVEPVDYVQICDLYGDGFFFIPGTNTCLELSGFVRFEARFNGDDAPADGFTGGANALITTAPVVVTNPVTGLPVVLDRDTDNFNFVSKAGINFDARTETEMGTLRGFIATETSTSVSVGLGSLNVDQAYIEFEIGAALVRAGHAPSLSGVSGPSVFSNATVFESGVGNSTQIAFLFDIGPISAGIGIIDPETAFGAQVFDGFGATNAALVNTTGLGQTTQSGLSNDLPFLEAEANFDLAGFSIQTGAIIGEIESRVRVFDSVTGNVLTREFDEIGYGVAASAGVDLGFTARFGASYAEGIADFGADFLGADARIGTPFGAVAGTTTAGALSALDIELVEAYSFYGQVGANVGIFEVNLVGTYGHIEYPNFQGGGRTTTGGNEAEAYTVALNASVQPVDGLTILGEVFYTDVDVDANVARSAGLNAATLNTGPGITDPDFDDDQFGALFRLQRSF